MFTGTLTGRRLSWSEYRSGGGSLKLSQAKAKKLMDECGHVTDWEDATVDETEHPVKAHKGTKNMTQRLVTEILGKKVLIFLGGSAKFNRTEKVSLLSRLFRRRSPSKKRNNTLNTFSAQFPPPEWLEFGGPNNVLHLHSVAVQTQSSDVAGANAEVKVLDRKHDFSGGITRTLIYVTEQQERHTDEQHQVGLLYVALFFVAQHADSSFPSPEGDTVAAAVAIRFVQPAAWKRRTYR